MCFHRAVPERQDLSLKYYVVIADIADTENREWNESAIFYCKMFTVSFQTRFSVLIPLLLFFQVGTCYPGLLNTVVHRRPDLQNSPFLNLRTTFCKKNNAWLHYKPRSNRKFIMGKCKRLEVSYFQKSGKTATLFLGQNAAECLNVKRPLEREHFFCLSANDSFLLKKICCRLGISGRRPQTWNRLFLLNVL